MTTTVTIEACCEDYEEVLITTDSVTTGTTGTNVTIQSGEEHFLYVYGDTVVTIKEIKKEQSAG